MSPGRRGANAQGGYPWKPGQRTSTAAARPQAQQGRKQEMAKIQYNGSVRGADYIVLGKLVRNDAVAVSHELAVPADWVNSGRVGKQQADALKNALEHAVVEALKAQNALLEREPE